MTEPLDFGLDGDRAALAWRDPDLPLGARWAIVLTWLGDQPTDHVIGTVATMVGITEADWTMAARWLGGDPPRNMARS